MELPQRQQTKPGAANWKPDEAQGGRLATVLDARSLVLYSMRLVLGPLGGWESTTLAFVLNLLRILINDRTVRYRTCSNALRHLVYCCARTPRNPATTTTTMTTSTGRCGTIGTLWKHCPWRTSAPSPCAPHRPNGSHAMRRWRRCQTGSSNKLVGSHAGKPPASTIEQLGWGRVRRAQHQGVSFG
jgi:hypothetical protein